MGLAYSACGGDCKACPANGRCNGVSPTHPFGLCNDGIGGSAGYDPGLSCGSTPMCDGINVCAVLDVPAQDLAVARRYGVCMEQANCFDFASRFPQWPWLLRRARQSAQIALRLGIAAE